MKKEKGLLPIKKYNKEELANVITHGIGFLLSIIATIFLMKKGAEIGNTNAFYGLTIFGFSLIILYLASTLYHSIPFDKIETKAFFRRIDHIAIYILIAGSHTPFLLQHLEGNERLLYLSLIWGMVFLGLIFKLFFFEKWNWLSVVFYVVMGWSGLVTIPQMSKNLGEEPISWIFTGGILYTLGVFFYLRTKMPYHHAIWHLFVLAGSAAHFVAVWKSC